MKDPFQGKVENGVFATGAELASVSDDVSSTGAIPIELDVERVGKLLNEIFTRRQAYAETTDRTNLLGALEDVTAAIVSGDTDGLPDGLEWLEDFERQVHERVKSVEAELRLRLTA